MKHGDDLNDSRLELLVSQAADEFREAQSSHGAPDVEAFARKYPEISDTIRKLFPALLELERSHQKVQPTPDDVPLKRLGDFQIHGEIGRGGMGIVYEATQLSVQRQTALKVLPFANTLDENQLKRFKNEVRAAGALSHPNIVPVYSMGQERGVHYYAMQLIQGQSLAELIHDRSHVSAPLHENHTSSQVDRDVTDHVDLQSVSGASDKSSPAARPQSTNLAETRTESHQPTSVERGKEAGLIQMHVGLILQAAEAIAHAHDCGVIHRDIKPANLMVDVQGKLWVTDFGLARFEDSHSMTVPGDLVGTLRYMSPEQTWDERRVDQRTDIYSLGVTLYELLTLHPAIRGDSREVILKNVASVDPPPPRGLAPAISKTLEIIIQKAIEKNVEDRYPAMSDFAYDLRCFLEDKPIKARPATLVERTRKWARRHPSLVGVFAITSAITSLILAISVGLVIHEKTKTQNALETQEELRKRSDDSFGLARDVIRNLYSEQAYQLDDLPGMTSTQRKFLEEVVKFYEKIPKDESGTSQILRETSVAHSRLADAYVRLGNFPKGKEHYELAIGVLQSLVSENERPTGSDPRPFAEGFSDRQRISDLEMAADSVTAMDLLNLAGNRQALGDAIAELRHFDQALECYNQTLKELESILQSNQRTEPPWRARLLHSRTQKRIADIHEARGNLNLAESLLQSSLNARQILAERHPTSGDVHYQLASSKARYAAFLHTKKGETKSAETQLRSALATLSVLRARHPNRIKYKSTTAKMTNDLALLCVAQAHVTEGLELHGKSIDHWKQLCEQFPDRPSFRKELANTYGNIGGTFHHQRRFDKAVESFDEAIRIVRELSHEFPQSHEFKPLLAGNLANQANVYERMNRLEECRTNRSRVLELWSSLARDYASRADYRAHLAMAHYSISNVSDTDTACEHLHLAIPIMTELAERYPETPSHQARLTTCLSALGGRLASQEKYDEAESTYLEAILIAGRLAEKWPRVPDYSGKIARRLRRLGNLYFHTGRYADAIKAYSESLTIQEHLFAKTPEYSKSSYAAPIVSLHALIGSAMNREKRVNPNSQYDAEIHFSKLAELVTSQKRKLAFVFEIRHVLDDHEIAHVLSYLK